MLPLKKRELFNTNFILNIYESIQNHEGYEFKSFREGFLPNICIFRAKINNKISRHL